MKTNRLSLTALLPLLIVFPLAGCSDPDNRRPADAMKFKTSPVLPKKPPSTVEEKIAAIKNAPLTDKEKQAAMDQVRSGKL